MFREKQELVGMIVLFGDYKKKARIKCAAIYSDHHHCKLDWCIALVKGPKKIADNIFIGVDSTCIPIYASNLIFSLSDP